MLYLSVFGTPGKDWQTEWNFAYTAVFMNSTINSLFHGWSLRKPSSGSCKDSKEDVVAVNKPYKSRHGINQGLLKNRFHVARRLFSNGSQITSKSGEKRVKTSSSVLSN